MGTGVALEAPGPVLVELQTVLADLEPRSAATRRLQVEAQADGRFRLVDSGAVVQAGIEPSIVAATVVWHLNTVAADTPHHVVVHAGCVADRSAVVLPGPSGTGKSTLVAACVEAGMSYLSDEYALLDLRTGTMTPYAKPLALDGERLVASSLLRADAVGGPVAPGRIVFPCYAPDDPPSSTPLTPGWTILALAAHTTNLTTLGGAALPWLAGLATTCPSWRITYREAAETVAAMCEGAAAPVDVVTPTATIGPVTAETTTVTLGEELAVFDEPTGTVHLLNPTAAFVWACVPDAPDPRRLTETVLARATDRSLDPSMVSATIERLVEMHLLSDRYAPPVRS